jgi:hypothetical protein
MLSNFQYPKVKPYQYVVLQCEADTGILLNLYGERHSQESAEECYMVFDSLAEASNYSKLRTKQRNKIECNIYNSNGNFVIKFTDPNFRSEEMPNKEMPSERSRRSWLAKLKDLFS